MSIQRIHPRKLFPTPLHIQTVGNYYLTVHVVYMYNHVVSQTLCHIQANVIYMSFLQNGIVNVLY